MRILLDTNILARAASGPPGLANELVLAATHHDYVLLLSPFRMIDDVDLLDLLRAAG